MEQFRILHKGFNFSQDGPGNRLVYHLLGCNLRCPWCSNPESMELSTPHTLMAVEELLDEARRSSKLFFDGGGVTFTGGEPTLQLEPLAAALKALKAEKIGTAIETNGTSPLLAGIMDDIDFLIIDFKHYDAAKHLRVTGASNEQVIKNLRAAVQKKGGCLVRIPLINGFNASARDACEFASVLTSLGGKDIRLEILPYHEYGRDKWAACGKEYKMKDAFVADAQRLEFEKIVTASGIVTVRT